MPDNYGIVKLTGIVQIKDSYSQQLVFTDKSRINDR